MYIGRHKHNALREIYNIPIKMAFFLWENKTKKENVQIVRILSSTGLRPRPWPIVLSLESRK